MSEYAWVLESPSIFSGLFFLREPGSTPIFLNFLEKETKSLTGMAHKSIFS